ncbi:MAG: redox-sensing transcriptional repressor Rex [Clostridiales bacterium]|nr:redox-sensing transcriptional repressor Rex [Clostridiales bacterium]
MAGKEKGKISDAVIRRLPRYRRCLDGLMKAGVERISSGELSAMIGYTASQIRQDLNNFGGFGQQGYGYNVKSLYERIGEILGLDREYKMVIVGAGNLGSALVNYAKYQKWGFYIVAMFDVLPELIGTSINDTPVYSYTQLDQYLQENKIDIGVICTGKGAAPEVMDKLVAGGVKGIWNFAATDLSAPEGIPLENVHLSDSLNALTYYMLRSNPE